MLTLQCGNRDADAAPADLVPARPGMGRGHRRSSDRAGPGSQRHVPPPVVHQAICRTGGGHAAAPGTARDHRTSAGRAGGHRGRQARPPRPAEPLPPAVPVRRRGARHGTGLRDPPVPRRRIGGRPLPPGALRHGAVRRRAASRRALVRPARARARAGRPGAGRRPRTGRRAGIRRRAGHCRHRRPVAHRLALPGARLPAHLLGRRHDAGPAAGPGRLGRPARRAVYPLPRRRGGRADRRGPGARVPGGGGGPGRCAARPRRGRPGGPRRRGRRAAGVPPGHGGSASRGERPARPGVGPRPRRAGARRQPALR